MSTARCRRDERHSGGTLYFLGRPYATYAEHYGVPLRDGRPLPRRSFPAAVA